MLKLETLQEKPWYMQAAVFGVVALLLYAGFYYFVTSGTRAETAKLNAQIADLQGKNETARIASQRINDFRAAYARTQAEYDDLKALLPEQRELTSVLGGIQDRARGRLSLRRFSPKDDTQHDFYSGKPIEVEVSGTYNNLGQFFAQMAGYQRIVSITDFKVNRTGGAPGAANSNAGKTIEAQFLITAYYVSSEKLQISTTAATTKPDVAPAAATTTAAPAPAK
ncbi:MAG: type 4a pilus biogenesis protein PilO [Pyrinomonadaceae bacterium]|nr:type 4a pilus biogenesis protein PilO [Pyrinomonadaceae bacterium]